MKINENSSETGMPMPTISPLRMPMAATTTTITKARAVKMFPCSSVTCCRAMGAWSWE